MIRGGVVTVMLLLAAGAAAQLPPGALPHSGSVPPAPLPAPPDTALVGLAWPDSVPAPATVHVVPDTVDFGGLVHVVADFADGGIAAPALADSAAAPWLVAAPRPTGWRAWLGRGGPDLPSGLPAPEGERAAWSFRVYRTDPFVLATPDGAGPVIHVRGRVATADSLVTVRDPRRLGRLTWKVYALAAAILAVLALMVWWWRRRRRAERPADWRPAAPAWPTAVLGLDSLLRAGDLERGDGAGFLDSLARLVRGYAADRYGIAAREMTGGEIAAACSALGYESGFPRALARLVDDADRRRFDPLPPEAHWCREQAVQFFGCLDRVRTTTAAPGVAGADQAWNRLLSELGAGAGREAV